MYSSYSKSYHFKSRCIFYTSAIFLILFFIPLCASGKTAALAALDETLEYDIESDSDKSEEMGNQQDLFVNREQWLDRNVPEIKDFTSGIEGISTESDDHLPYYDILGRKVSSSAKGILIHAGKKYIIR